ncbi:hypothetical protein Aam_031_002 [Acidocella aminolytica 101 = DSM 11237]|uniref:Uncharacterized protein n=1 Tax=Acidocella aminolytica 101 = DSM 11237 TaxID=1120923 RepID=A0A0D6PEQ1_9PROT|nr:hypothetical protein Aam_031_002 [Acidocella aminolytica 101 = DSM 11237]GBQ36573.1 hypothetical protein AA11237_1277 [Acidocella aminolytica 101 = DSM 11237]
MTSGAAAESGKALNALVPQEQAGAALGQQGLDGAGIISGMGIVIAADPPLA